MCELQRYFAPATRQPLLYLLQVFRSSSTRNSRQGPALGLASRLFAAYHVVPIFYTCFICSSKPKLLSLTNRLSLSFRGHRTGSPNPNLEGSAMSQPISRRFLNTLRVMQEESRRLREASEVTQKQSEQSKQLVERSKKVTQAVESVRRQKTTVEPL